METRISLPQGGSQTLIFPHLSVLELVIEKLNLSPALVGQ
jgi:hypothetical protein